MRAIIIFFNRKTRLWTNLNQQWASWVNVVFWFPALFAEVLSTYNSYLRQTELQMFSNVSYWSLLCPLNPKTQQPFNCNFPWLISSKETQTCEVCWLSLHLDSGNLINAKHLLTLWKGSHGLYCKILMAEWGTLCCKARKIMRENCVFRQIVWIIFYDFWLFWLGKAGV